MDYNQKIQKFARNHQGSWFYVVAFPLVHTITLYNGMIYYGLRIILDAYPKNLLLELAREHLTQAAAVKTPQFLKNRG